MLGQDRNIVSLRTAQGIQLAQFMPSDQLGLTWRRETRQTTTCELTAQSPFSLGRTLKVTPWLHWVDVFDSEGETLLWSGPVLKGSSDREQLSISARDPSLYFTRTRCPITKRWEATDPAFIAEELLTPMTALHNFIPGVRTRPDPLGDRYDFAVVADKTMLDATIGDLTNLGMYWCVVGGTFLLGPQPRKPITALSMDHFLGGGPIISRDGSQSFNDVILRAADTISRGKVEMGGLNLQAIHNIDSMFGVTNADRALLEYIRYTGLIKNTISVPDGTILHPDAPVSLAQLVPSARINVEAYGELATMEISAVEVTQSSDRSTVGVTMVIVDDELPELIQLEKKQATTGTDGGTGGGSAP